MRALYDSKSKTIDDRGMKTLLGQQARVQSWLDVEAALALAQAEHGMIPAQAAENIAANCRVENIDLVEMERLLREIGHGFVPVIKVLVKACDSESGKYVHYGVTTQNIQQTAQLYLAKQFNAVLQCFLNDILHNLASMAREHHATLMAGRTHGKHALPITWGYKAAVWIDELLSARERMQEAEKRVFTVMMGGAVGAFHATGETGRRVQESVAQKLGMRAMAIPSRNSRVYRTEYISNLCLLATTLHKIAEEVYQTSSEEFLVKCLKPSPKAPWAAARCRRRLIRSWQKGSSPTRKSSTPCIPPACTSARGRLKRTVRPILFSTEIFRRAWNASPR